MSNNSTFGREPIQVVQIDQDFCTRTYSAASDQTALGPVGTRPLTLETGYFGAIENTSEVADAAGSAGLKVGDPAQPDNLSARTDDAATIAALIAEIAATEELTVDVWVAPFPREPAIGESITPILQIISTDNNDDLLTLSYQQRPEGGTGLSDNVFSLFVSNDTDPGSTSLANSVLRESDGLPNRSTVLDGTLKRITFTVSGGGPGTGQGSTAKGYYNGQLLDTNTLSDEAWYLGNWGSAGFGPSFLLIGGLYQPTAYDSDGAVFNRLRVYKKELSQSEIDASAGGSVADPAALLMEVAPDASIEQSRGCNAAKATNLITFSEVVNSNAWTYGSDLVILPNQLGYNGYSFNRLQPGPGATVAGANTAFSSFRSEPGQPVEFAAVFSKTAYAGTLSVGFTIVIQQSGSGFVAQVDLDINAQTGTLIADNSTTPFFDYEFSITDLGDYFKVSAILTPQAQDEADTSDCSVSLNMSGMTDSDVFSFGAARITFEPGDQYTKTNGVRKLKTGNAECFNTRSTCQDPTNYDKGTLPLKFVDNRSPGLTDDYYLPSLQSVKVTPAKLNPGGADRNSRALGQRAAINLSFMDHPHDDRVVDKYRTLRDYDPFEQGTFWTKWRARNPYYMQRLITLRSGYLDNGSLADEITRKFVITGFTGPDSTGRVSIQGKDILTLAEDDKAQAPAASNGKLNAAITAGATSATLTPAGIGNAEYPASGFARIGKEVISFTRSGDSLTLTRGQFGTAAVSHDEDDTVQLCLRYVSEAPQDILYDLLLNYAGIPAEFLDKAQWDAEALDFLPRLYTAVITEPEGVSKLISEMCQQMYFSIWWDERLGKVVLKSVRLAQEDEVFELDDQRHLIADSISWTDLADQLITQVWVYYGQIDPTDKLDQGSNYSTIAITADPDAEGADKHNLRRVKTIFSRWIDAANASAAEDLGRRILDRYGNAPRQVTFRVDAKDDYLWLGDYIRLTNRLRTDRFGVPQPVNLQIFEAEEASLGSEYKFTAQEFIPALIGGDEVPDPTVRTIPITSDLLNVNLRTLHDSLFGAPVGNETITFIVREGVTLGGDTAGGGVNVPFGQRVTTADFYDAGANAITGAQVGQVPFLQRVSISSPRTINAGEAYESLGQAAYTVVERPVSVALRTGSWPAGVTLKLVVEGGARVIGEAGNGSCHYTQSTLPGYDPITGVDLCYRAVPGGDGGDSLNAEYPIEITNGGVIAGGGAGGGSNNFKAFEDGGKIRLDSVFGGGGAGLNFSSTKENASFDDTPVTRKQINSERDAAAGGYTSPGQGGRLDRLFGQFNSIVQTAGTGGALAAAGAASSLSVATFFENRSYSNTGSGGLPGKAVSAGANLIQWGNKGDVRGDEVT